MSYDYYLFMPEPGVDPAITVERLLEDEQVDIFGTSQPRPEYEQRKQQLAEALVRFNPALEVFAFDYAAIAASEGISEAEARRRYRHVELNQENGIQIELFDTTVEVAVPFGYSGHEARTVMRELWGYLKLLAHEAGFAVYDPQMDHVVGLNADFELALAYYTGSLKISGEIN